MTEDELNQWARNGHRDEAARRELVLFYLPLVDLLAKRIAFSTRTSWQDLRQEGAIGLMKAIERFDPRKGAPFKSFAKHHIRGAIFASTEITRDMSRRQRENHRRVMKADDELIQALQRHPTIEEVAKQAQLTKRQILDAIDARGVARPKAMPDAEYVPASVVLEAPPLERTLALLEALAHLSEREQQIIRLYYWEDQSHDDIARALELTVANVTKIRQRAIVKLREILDEKREGGQNEDRRPGE
jgi:RNA polymerase sigma factor (sigma-70 family)